LAGGVIISGMAFERLTTSKVQWINITDASIHDIAALRRMFPQFHPLNLEDSLSHIERSKVDFHDDYLYIVLIFPQFDRSARLTRGTEVDFFIGKNYIVTIHDGVLKPLNRLWDACERDEVECTKLLGKSAGHTFYVIIDQLVDYVFPILNKIEGNLRAIEETIFDDNTTTDLIREITLVRRDIIALRRIIRQQIPILQSIERAQESIVHEDLEEYFGDLIDHTQKARDIIDEDFEIISGLSDTADKLLTHRLNSVIRVLTIISVILLPLSLIASMFGMNVRLPFESRPDAFVIITLLMIGISGAMLLFFRRRRWL
jgi:magnesium transporter